MDMIEHMNDNSQLFKIQRDLLEGTVSTTRMLQNCMLLAGATGSTELRTWARRELEGYPGDADLPGYRKIFAQIYVDGQNGAWFFKEQSIGPEDLPEVVREAGINNKVLFYQGLAELEALATRDDQFIHLSLPRGDMIKKIMNHELCKREPYAQYHRVYYAASRAAIHGVVEGVRTALADLVSELVRTLPSDQQLPSKEQADQAVHFTVTGEHSQVSVTNSRASGSSTSTATTTVERTEKDESWWKRWRKRGIIIGIFSMCGATAGVLNYLQIAPWS